MSLGDGFTLAGYGSGIGIYLWASRRLWPAQRTLWWQSLIVLAAGYMGGVSGAKAVQLLLGGWGPDALRVLSDPLAGGRTVLGGLLIGWACVELAKWLLGLRGSTGGPFALAIPAGEALGRIGCWLNGCCYGAVSGLPQGLPFTVYQHGAWRIPAQLYSSLAMLLLFAALLRLSRRAESAELFRWFLLLYGGARFGLEFARYRETLHYGLSLAQWVALELALAGGIALAVTRRGTA